MLVFLRRLALLVFPLVALAFAPAAALAASDPYTAGATGYDVSSPQCGATTPPGSFAVLGVDSGRPFSKNGCLSNEYQAAPTAPAPSLYLNTGYSLAYKRFVSSGCSAAAAAVPSGEQEAYAIGCSEADFAVSYAAQQGASAVSMWWLDIETANSWTGSALLHQAAIQGAVDRLNQTGLPVGIYSTAAMWSAITGSGPWNPTGAAADWVAGASSASAASSACSNSFTGAPVWLVQYPGSTADADYACP